MGSIWLHSLPDALESLGNVSFYSGWETRSRSSGGYNALLGIVVHHTASKTSTASDCNYMWNVSENRPVGAIYLARDGEVCVGAAGATNCAGKGGPYTTSKGTIPLDSGNANTISIEAGNNGVGEAWPQAQQDAYVSLVAALCSYYDFDPLQDVMAHFEWTSRKIDPAGQSRYANGADKWNMDLFRGDVAEKVGGGQLPIPPTPEPEPEPPSTEEDERMLGLVRLDSNPNAIYVMDGINARKVRSDEVDELTSNLQYDTGFRYYDLTATGRPQIRDVNKIPKRPDDQLQLWGIETTESVEQPG